jgi:ribose transport system permease protein
MSAETLPHPFGDATCPAQTGGRLSDRIDWRLVILLLSMAGVTAFFGSLNAYYMTLAHFLDMARQAALLIVIALGANLVIVSGEIDLSIGAVIGLVSVSVPALFDINLPAPLVILGALLVGAAVGAANGLITLWMMVPSFLTTLGTMAIVRGIAIYISDQPRQIYDDLFTTLLSGNIAGLPQAMIYSFALTALMAVFWRYSRFSLHVRAVGSNRQSARFSGLPADRVKFIVFVLAGALSAAGALLLLGQTQTGLAVSSEGIELNAIASVILGGGRLGGGKGSVVGTFLGAVLLTMVFSGIAGMGLTAAWQLLTKGSILVIVILLMRR